MFLWSAYTTSEGALGAKYANDSLAHRWVIRIPSWVFSC